MSQEKIGLDFGRVIMGAVRNGQADTSFLGTTFNEAMQSKPEPGAFDVIGQLVDWFAAEVWIVSKCGPSVENKTRGWLKHWNFYAETGVDREKVRFCRQRSEKALICRQLGITQFVDDRFDVLTPMRGIVPKLYLFGEQDPTLRIPDWVIPVADWQALLECTKAQRMSEACS